LKKGKKKKDIGVFGVERAKVPESKKLDPWTF